MMRGKWQWFLLALPLALGGGMALGETPSGRDIGDLVKGINAFAFNLYSQLKADKNKNIFFSPWSLSSAFAITYEGARGQTASEIQKVFNLPSDSALRRESFLKLYQRTNQSKDYILRTANALWAQKKYPFLKSYKDIVLRYYKGNITNLDFVGNPEASRQTINSWVAKQTNDKIKDLLPRGSITPLTRLVITNAVYFKGTWLIQFDPKQTKEEDFKVNPDKTIKVPMMCLKEKQFPYAETDNLQVLELPYKGEEISMLILLPKGFDLKPAEEALNPDKLKKLETNLRRTEVDVYLPKFKLETKYFLVDTLKRMGMKRAFQGGMADFSGMDGTKTLFITSVIHQGYVDVNEEGTEAAAATGVVVGRLALTPRKIFRADHPFLFLIRDRKTGLILFLGRLMEPQK